MTDKKCRRTDGHIHGRRRGIITGRHVKHISMEKRWPIFSRKSSVSCTEMGGCRVATSVGVNMHVFYSPCLNIGLFSEFYILLK